MNMIQQTLYHKGSQRVLLTSVAYYHPCVARKGLSVAHYASHIIAVASHIGFLRRTK